MSQHRARSVIKDESMGVRNCRSGHSTSLIVQIRLQTSGFRRGVVRLAFLKMAKEPYGVLAPISMLSHQFCVNGKGISFELGT